MINRKSVIAGFLSFYIIIGICGCSTVTVYESENIDAVVTDSDDEKELLVQIKVAPSDLPETLKQFIKENEPIYDFEIQLSDGMYYGYHDETNDKNGGAFIETFSAISDIEEMLDKNFVNSTEIKYPDGKENFILHFMPADNSVSITSAKVTFRDKISVQETLYMNYGKSNRRFVPCLTGVTDKIYCEESDTSFGKKTLTFIDETVDQAGVYLEMEGIIYWWSFEGDFNKEDIILFIKTLEK